MKVTIDRASAVARKLGPICIACGNTRLFWVHAPSGDERLDIREAPDGEVRVQACGRCRSRNSIVIAHVD